MAGEQADMGYDAFLAAAVAGEIEGLRTRPLLEVRPTGGADLLLVLGPRSRPAWVHLAGEPLGAVAVGSGTWPGISLAWGADPPPPAFTAFARLLEARLAGRRLVGGTAVPWERTLELAFGPHEGLRGDGEPAYLVHEAAPRPVRLALLRSDRTVAALWPPAVGEEDRLHTGVRYTPPPSGCRHSPAELAADPVLLAEAMEEARRSTPGETGPSPAELLLRVAPSLGPRLARELGREPSLQGALAAAVDAYRAGRFSPVVVVIRSGPARCDPRVADVCALPVSPSDGETVLPCPTAGEAVALWHQATRVRLAHEALAARVSRALRSALKRARTKRARQEADLASAGDAEELRRLGELLLANLHAVPAGRDGVTLHDWDRRPVRVPLDPRLSPAANAQRYFARYRKARRSAEADEPRRRTEEELRWLEGLWSNLETILKTEPANAGPGPGAAGALSLAALWDATRTLAASLEGLADLEADLTEAGLLRSDRCPRATGIVRDRRPPGAPRRFVTDDGLEVLAGRSARDNLALSLVKAAPHDLWFHARGYPGAHVILRTPGAPGALPPATSLLQAAALAAHLSPARTADKVPVDWTEARHLRHPKGAPPGVILYDPHRTLVVDMRRASLPREVPATEPRTTGDGEG